MLSLELTRIIEELKRVGTDHSKVEIKSCSGGFPSRLWETISAFANTNGGLIILGIEEEPRVKIVGVNDPKQFQQHIAELCSAMVPRLLPSIDIHTCEGKRIVTIEVAEVSYKEKPCYYGPSGLLSGSFTRLADGDRQLTQYEISTLKDNQGQPQYDKELVPEASLADLDSKALNRFLTRVREKDKFRAWDDTQLLLTHSVIGRVGGKIVPTLAGLLCFGVYPQQFFPALVTHVLVYPTNEESNFKADGARFLHNSKVEGSIVNSVVEIIQEIKKNIQKRSSIKGLFREDILEYPEVFLREAVANALAHRDYSPHARGTAVQVKLFPNRLQIESPGGLFGPITIEQLRSADSGLQTTRNTFLMRILEALPVSDSWGFLCENRGSGILEMKRALSQAGMEAPQFSSSYTQFKVRCSNETLFNQDTVRWLERYTAFQLNSREQTALVFLRQNKKITRSDYCKINHCDTGIASKELAILRRKQILISNSKGRATHYTLSELFSDATIAMVLSNSSAGGLKIFRADLPRIKALLELFQKQSRWRRSELAKALNWPDVTVMYWLRKLIDNRMLTTTTQNIKSPNTEYFLPYKHSQ